MRRAIAVVGALAMPLALAMNADASTGAVGWWTRSPLASAPDGGFAVGNAPDGPLSVAAVEIDLGTNGVASGTLSFEQVGGTAPGAGQLVACVVGSSGFEATSGGPISEAPATACETISVAATASETAWSVQVGELVRGQKGTVGIALVPATGSTGFWDLQADAPSFEGTPARASSSTNTAGPTTTVARRSSPLAGGAAQTARRPPAPTLAVPSPGAAAEEVTTSTTLLEASSVAAGTSTFRSTRGTTGREGRPIGQAVTMVIIAVAMGVGGGVAHKFVISRFSI